MPNCFLKTLGGWNQCKAPGPGSHCLYPTPWGTQFPRAKVEASMNSHILPPEVCNELKFTDAHLPGQGLSCSHMTHVGSPGWVLNKGPV